MDALFLRLLSVLIGWVWLLPAPVHAHASETPPYPDLRFTRHDGPEGPFRQTFTRLYMDRDGFLWGATLDSVFRFDGHTFQQWPVAGSISADFSEDSAQRLWVMTQNEIWRFERGRIERTRVPLPTTAHGWGTALAHGQHGTWLLMSDGRLFQYSVKAGAFLQRWRPSARHDVVGGFGSAAGSLWWLTDRGLWRFAPHLDRTPHAVERFARSPSLSGNFHNIIDTDKGKAICLPLTSGVHCVLETGEPWIEHKSNARCTALQVDGRQRLHALCGTTLWSQLDPGTPRLVARLSLPQAADFAYQIQVDTNGHLWLSLGHGFGILNPDTGAFQATPIGADDDTGRSLPSPTFETSIMLADRTHVWLALNGKGLYRARLASTPFEHWVPPVATPAATSPLLRAVYEDRTPQGRQLWVADATSQVWRVPIDGHGHLHSGIPVAIPSPSALSECRALIRAPDGQLLYATQDQLLAYRTKSDALHPVHVQWPPDAPPMRLCGLHRDKHDQLWTYGAFGIAKLKADGAGGYLAEVFPTAASITSDLFDALYEGSDGLWWLPTRYGIWRFDPRQHRWQILSRPKVPLAAEWIHQVIEQPTGRYWVATRGGGLQRLDLDGGRIFDADRWSVVRPPPNSESPIRYSMLPDADGHLWLAGGRGLDRYDPQHERWLHFDASSGLQQIEFNHGVATVLSDGRLIFGGLNGLTLVRPALVGRPNSPPVPQWRGVQIEGGALHGAGQSLQLAHGRSVLTVHYHALDYDAPDSIRYRYRLHGDASWIDVGSQRQVHFGELASGAYRLELQAAYTHGEWPTRGIVLPIRVDAPWYRRWPAITAAAALSLFALLAYVGARNRRQRYLENEVLTRTRELREATSDLVDTNRRLGISNHELHRSHDDLRMQKNQLELALAAREHLFRQVSHDFRTPLAKIIIPLDDMIQSAQTSDETKRLRSMRTSAYRLRDMVDTLLEKARAKSEIPSEPERIPVAHEIRMAVASFADITTRKQQALSLECGLDEDVSAVFSRDCVTTILDNLLSNASKYTHEGGDIRVYAQVADGMLMLRVSDTGIGMDDEILSRLYTPFFRAPHASSAGAQGHGLGMYLVLELVRSNGGEITVDSKLGHGTTFTVHLPIHDRTSIAPGMLVRENPMQNIDLRAQKFLHAAPAKATDRSKTLLIIEDDCELRAMLVERLSDSYRCIESGDGAAAISIAHEQLPDLILCDVDLPGVNGFDVCASLKTNEHTAHIPVLFLTAYAGDRYRLQALRSFGDDYIEKPPSIEELRLMIGNRLRALNAVFAQARQTASASAIILPDVATKDEKAAAAAIRFRSRLEQLLSANYAASDYGVVALSADMHCSSRKLQRLMDKYVIGTTPIEYIQRFRLRIAAELLLGDRTVTEIATACGLNVKTFSAQFRKLYGASPNQWRKNR